MRFKGIYYCLCALCCLPMAQANELEEITIQVHPLAGASSAQNLTVLSERELAQKVQGSLGETIANEVGIRSASYGSAVGRPVIRGLGGPRIKTTQDRIDSLDLSVTSTDHAVTIEPFIANQITILKGASTLLYGAGAIGGVVDVETGRIAHQLPEQALSGKFEVRTADNANATTLAGRLDAKIADNWVWHIDAYSRDADEYEIPVPAIAGSATDTQSTLAGSQVENTGGAIGLTHVTDQAHIGVSIARLTGVYGLVGAPEADGEGDEETGVIDLAQTRFDLDAQWLTPLRGVNSIGLRLGVNDYQHAEIEGDGELGTLFSNEAWEARLDLEHQAIADFTGVVGLQLSDREFSALGEEAFVIPVDSDSLGLFWVGERRFHALDLDFDLEVGARIERVSHTPVDASQQSLDFTDASFSIGAILAVSPQLNISALFDYSNRAPTIEELYSNGAHLATQSFEVGDLSLDSETANNVSFNVDYNYRWLELNASAYYTQFDDFIFQANNGEIEDDLPVLVFQQDDAEFIGLEVSAKAQLAQTGLGAVSLSAQFDAVRARLNNAPTDGNRNLPRIPSNRLSVGLALAGSAWNASLDYQYVDAQDNTASFTTATASYNDFSLHVSRNINVAEQAVVVFLHARNLSNTEQRRHTSFVKDFAPSPGRRVEIGARLAF